MKKMVSSWVFVLGEGGGGGVEGMLRGLFCIPINWISPAILLGVSAAHFYHIYRNFYEF